MTALASLMTDPFILPNPTIVREESSYHQYFTPEYKFALEGVYYLEDFKKSDYINLARSSNQVSTQLSFNSRKIIKIHDLIGNDRFEKLNLSQIKFLASTVGIIKLDKSLDINQLYTYAKYAEY